MTDLHADIEALREQNAIYAELRKFAIGQQLLDRLRTHFIEKDLEGLMWVLPTTLLSDLATFYGVPVHHADVPGPMLAHRFPLYDPTSALLKAGQDLAREMAAEMGEVTEDELQKLRKEWPADD